MSTLSSPSTLLTALCTHIGKKDLAIAHNAGQERVHKLHTHAFENINMNYQACRFFHDVFLHHWTIFFFTKARHWNVRSGVACWDSNLRLSQQAEISNIELTVVITILRSFNRIFHWNVLSHLLPFVGNFLISILKDHYNAVRTLKCSGRCLVRFLAWLNLGFYEFESISLVCYDASAASG